MQIEAADGRRLDVWVGGPAAGLPLVWQIGTPGSGLPFALVADLAAGRGLRLVTYSRPGYGDSTRLPGREVVQAVADVETILDSIGAEQAYLLGWSGGGPHALAAAARLPDRVLGVAIIGSVAPYPADGLDYLAGMGAENVEEFEAAMAGPEALIGFKERAWPVLRQVSGEELAEAFGDLIDEVDRAVLTGALTDWLAANMREGLRTGYWGWFDDDLAFVQPWGFELDELRVPVHVWQGGHDRMVPFAHGEWLAAHIPHAIAHLLPEQGHLSLVTSAAPAILDSLLRGGPHG